VTTRDHLRAQASAPAAAADDEDSRHGAAS
jgi:hypothetical protein